jgi:hypothetical protein
VMPQPPPQALYRGPFFFNPRQDREWNCAAASADAACHATAPRPVLGYMKWTSTAAGVSGDSSKGWKCYVATVRQRDIRSWASPSGRVGYLRRNCIVRMGWNGLWACAGDWVTCKSQMCWENWQGWFESSKGWLDWHCQLGLTNSL